MLSKYVEKNSFGGYTWHIKFDSLFHIFIHSSESRTYIVEFKEWKWLNYKTRFSFVSNSELEQTIVSSFDRVYEYFSLKKDYLWTAQQKEYKLSQVRMLLKNNPELQDWERMNSNREDIFNEKRIELERFLKEAGNNPKKEIVDINDIEDFEINENVDQRTNETDLD